MPNAATFRVLADNFDSCADRIGNSLKASDEIYAKGIVKGGKLGLLTERTFNASHAHLASAVAELRVLATECRLRAVNASSFAEQMREWRIAMATYTAAVNAYNAALTVAALKPGGPQPVPPGPPPIKPGPAHRSIAE